MRKWKKATDVWELVAVKGLDECWPFLGYVSPKDGYGQIILYYKNTKPHVVVYELVRGSIPDGLIVMHLCNTRICCNPFHLKAGTYSENTQHAVRSGSFAAGLSQIVGVRFDKSRSRWISSARYDGTRINLYQGRDFFEACCARKAWDAKFL